eukprot:TRINITY_DN1086_c0_g1_i3.p1 TRINITY_DN1086_c0_g1~~TRINITY_DN1086_c0_g1_i3.p1  ORF type:complete len:178 (+),score=46.49 TRINITY_DN1086_c0_g1_i3:87-620(+)
MKTKERRRRKREKREPIIDIQIMFGVASIRNISSSQRSCWMKTTTHTKWNKPTKSTTKSTLQRGFQDHVMGSSTKYPIEQPNGKVYKRAGRTIIDTGGHIIRDDSPDVAGFGERDPMKLISEVPVIEVAGRKAICDGGHGALGHPRVFINLDNGKPNVCGYCGIRFQKKEGDHGHHH